jgi:type VI secretion system protein ImpA
MRSSLIAIAALSITGCATADTGRVCQPLLSWASPAYRCTGAAPAPEPEPEPEAEAEDAEAAPAAGGSSGGRSPSGNIVGREDAFKTLMKVAEFFRRTEPHSPVSYALEQAVRWGRMPLPDLIKDLVSDDTVRREFFRRTGIKPDSNDD